VVAVVLMASAPQCCYRPISRVIPLIAYPNWSDARTFCIFVGWRVARPLLILASSTRLIPACCKLSADGRIRALEASTVCARAAER
jgi:hypothetical protein